MALSITSEGGDVEEFVQQLATGLATGSVYAALALAIVLIYQTTSVTNFAQGEMATFGTFVAWSLMLQLDYWPAFLLAVLVSAFMGAVLEFVVLRRVEDAPVLNSVIVTLGLFTFLNSFTLWRWGGIPKAFPSPAVFSGAPLSVGEITISRLNIGIFCMTVLIMIALFLFLNYTKQGLAMRATAQNPVAARLVGIPVGRMLTLGWALAAAVGAVGGMLLAPILALQPSMMFGVLIFAFAAAVLGGLNSLPGAIVGGLILGVVQNMAGTYLSPHTGSIDVTVAFALIVLVLVIRPAGLLGHERIRRV
jgi:branched-chain amino acid transport system permease protein